MRLKRYIALVLGLVVALGVIYTPVNASGLLTSDFVGSEEQIDFNEDAIKNTIIRYYDLSYEGWYSLKYPDLSKVLDLNSVQCYNKVQVLNEKIDEWKYLIKNGIFTGTRDRLDISYQFDKIEVSGDIAQVEVSITHDETDPYITHADDGICALPFFVNQGSNSFDLIKKDGCWLITGHEYTDIVFYEKSVTEKYTYDLQQVEEKLDQIYACDEMMGGDVELAVVDSPTGIYTDYPYSPARAVNYANTYCVDGNSIFYYAAERDCTNFVSQCISYGYGPSTSTSMTSFSSFNMVQGTYYYGWYAGGGGGSDAWEDVDAHWDYMFSDKLGNSGPVVTQVSQAALQNGDVMQIDFEQDNDYNHSVICVSASELKIAQHSPNEFRYINEFSGTIRFYRPIYFRVYH